MQNMWNLRRSELLYNSLTLLFLNDDLLQKEYGDSMFFIFEIVIFKGTGIQRILIMVTFI